jgi:primosomal protein N' (replication factor Y) (superfamily II helicase)
MRIASVVLDIPTQAFDQGFSYEVPSEMEGISTGCAVLVPFGRRDAVGFVVAIEERIEQDFSFSLKPIKQVLTKPFFTELGAQCAQFLADRYVAPLSSCVRLFVPPGAAPRVERVEGRWQLTRPMTHQVDERWVVRLPEAETFKPRKTAVKQIAVLEALSQGDLRVSDLRAEYGSIDSVLSSLETKGVIKVEKRRRIRSADEVSEVFAQRVQNNLELTSDQQKAVSAIHDARTRNQGEVVLIDGVTGSGKTEVYLCAIEEVLANNQSAIVLVPEISLTPQTVARFRGRFGDTVAVLHSRMSNGERYDQWDRISTGKARVVVGARSALFAPVQNLGMVIIDEEHEFSYKQDQAPRYVTRDVSAWLVAQAGAVLVLGSATPSIESLYQCQENPLWQRVEMRSRANGQPLPEIQVVDMGKEFGSGNRKMFSRALQNALFEVIDKGQKAVLLLNQRGFAQFLLCRDCGFVPECEDCSTSLTYHETDARLKCHHCGRERAVPATCPKCGSPYLKRFGAGTQRVEAELRTLLAQKSCEIIRMDADTTSRKGAHQRLLEQFARADAAVLLGTQMIAKGLDFDEVTLVGVINADTMLHLPDFRSSERTFDLIEQVAGRSGRAHLLGKVIVQTYSANENAIRCAAHYDRERFLKEELALRSDLGYPPFVRLANVLLWGRDERAVQALGHELYAQITQAIASSGEEGWVVFPATACVLSRLKGVWRYHLLIKAPKNSDIAQVLAPLFRSRKTTEGVQVSLDIDPISLL